MYELAAAVQQADREREINAALRRRRLLDRRGGIAAIDQAPEAPASGSGRSVFGARRLAER